MIVEFKCRFIKKIVTEINKLRDWVKFEEFYIKNVSQKLVEAMFDG